jgi:RNA polymerase sigma factor (sigma-70 family)
VLETGRRVVFFNDGSMITTLSATVRPLPLTDIVMAAGHPSSRPEPGRSLDAEASFDLLVRARQDDAEALNELCRRYVPRLQRWAHGRLPAWARDALDTHDLVQDTLTSVFQKIPSFDPRHEGAFAAYVHLALRNRLLDAIRRARRRPVVDALDSDKSDPEPSPLMQAIGQETLDRYEEALQRIKPEEQAAIVLRVEMGYSYEEIAEELRKPTAAAASMAVRRALVRLAKEMFCERAD